MGVSVSVMKTILYSEIPLGVSFRFFDDLASAEKFAAGREVFFVAQLGFYYVEDDDDKLR